MRRAVVLFVLASGCATRPPKISGPALPPVWMEDDREACQSLADYCATADSLWRRWGEIRISCNHRKNADDGGLVNRLRLFGLEVKLDPEAADDDLHIGVNELPADQYLFLHLSMKHWACLVTEAGEVAVFPPERRALYESSTILEAGELAEARKDISGVNLDEAASIARDLRRARTRQLLSSRVKISGDMVVRDACAALAEALGKRPRVSPALWHDASRITLEATERSASETLAEIDLRRSLSVILRDDVLWFVER